MATCPDCGKELPPGEFPFCPFCTAPLGDEEVGHHSEERKVVSVLFCDLVGFTAASEHADPEDVRARLRPYHTQLRQVIERHGGTVEKFVGDAVMAVFGAPVAHEDDAERAVRAGLRVLEAMQELNEGDAKLQLQVRIGINTGEAVVTLGAHPERGEGFVAGDVINTASRLQAVAPLNGLAVSESTFRQTERVFTYVQLERVQVKGKAEPLAIWQPLAPRARFGSDVTRTYQTPLVGRELERPLLIAAFERAVQQRSCQLMTLVGEPGVGKTRMCSELLAYVERQPGLVRWRQGRSLPYGEGIAFWALGEIVKAECGILESDSPEDASVKLDSAIAPDEADRAWLIQRLAPLVGAGAEPAAQQESFTAWRRFLEGLAADAPTVLVFEDLHWADDTLLAFIEHLADWSEGVPLLLLCTARPEFHEQHPTWAATVRDAQRINLRPLTDAETTTLLALLLERAVLPSATQRSLLDRAGGNPLYAEEFVRLLGDRDMLAGPLEDVPFPDSLHALIAARLDLLSAERKSLLQDAAVVGKVFWAGALAAMGKRDPRDVEQALHELARKELIRSARSSSMQGEREYAFWHLLVRDACYAQIPRPARVARHRAAAAWIEAHIGPRADDLADVLAYHYVQAFELARASGLDNDLVELEGAARRYLALAGERALPIDVDSAEDNFARALGLTPAGHEERAALLERWADAARQQLRLTDATVALEEAIALHRDQGANVATARALTVLSNLLREMGDSRRDDVLAEALILLEAEPPGLELVNAYGSLAGARVYADAFAEAIAAAQRSLDLAAKLNLPEPAVALSWRGAARGVLGDVQGLDDIRRAQALSVEQGQSGLAATLYNHLALSTWMYRGPLVALELCDEGIAFCDRRGIADVASHLSGTRLYLLGACGRSADALAATQAAAEKAEASGKLLDLIEARSVQLWLASVCGETRRIAAAEELVAAARGTGEPMVIATALAAASALQCAKGRLGQTKLLLEELEQTSGARDDPIYAALVPQLVRRALVLEELALASKLIHGVEPRTPLQQHALATCRAALVEADGDPTTAAALYVESADRWRGFADMPELAYALCGQGRCMVALGRPQADAPLREARDLFRSMGYASAMAETETLLQGTRAASP